MNKPNDKTPKPAYVSYKSLTTYLDGIRELGHAPDVVDRGTMKNFSGATQNELLPALRFLGMTDDKSAPTPLLTEYALADDEARKLILAKILRPSYPFIFSNPNFNIERATENQTAELFREQGLNGSTNSRAIAFFLAAAKEAGIKISPYVKAPTIQRNGASKSKKAKASPPSLPVPETNTEIGGDETPPPGSETLDIPIPINRRVRLILPPGFKGSDWIRFKSMLDTYVEGWMEEKGEPIIQKDKRPIPGE